MKHITIYKSSSVLTISKITETDGGYDGDMHACS